MYEEVECPVCKKLVPLTGINAHLDSSCQSNGSAGRSRSNSEKHTEDDISIVSSTAEPAGLSGGLSAGNSISALLVGSRKRPGDSIDSDRRKSGSRDSKSVSKHSLNAAKKAPLHQSYTSYISSSVDSSPVRETGHSPAVQRHEPQRKAPPPKGAPNVKDNRPLAERLRPKSLEEYIGQEHLVGPKGILLGFIKQDRLPSLILWGPPGVGKTSIARIIAHVSKSRFVELSATQSGINECRKVFEEARNNRNLTKQKTILFCDEIHRFNKAQQDIFLPYVEKGDITLIGATTENPSFQLNSALLSRCRVFVLQKLKPEELKQILIRALAETNQMRREGPTVKDPRDPEKAAYLQLDLDSECLDYLADISDGDSRIALNLLEILDGHFSNISVFTEPESLIPIDQTQLAGTPDEGGDLPSEEGQIKEELDPEIRGYIVKPTLEEIKQIFVRSHMVYDRVGDAHYDTISAFHKSVRGSDPDAALFYLGRMLESGESPIYVARRMIRMASEDIGIADDSCLPFAIAAYQSALYVGMPECDVMLAHCAVKLALARKSVMVYSAWNRVKAALKSDTKLASAPIPIHLRNAPTKLMKELGYGEEYKYNPNYLHGKVKQRYMPEGLESLKFLHPGEHLGKQVDLEAGESPRSRSRSEIYSSPYRRAGTGGMRAPLKDWHDIVHDKYYDYGETGVLEDVKYETASTISEAQDESADVLGTAGDEAIDDDFVEPY